MQQQSGQPAKFYQAPKIVACGSITDLTKTSYIDPGSPEPSTMEMRMGSPEPSTVEMRIGSPEPSTFAP